MTTRWTIVLTEPARRQLAAIKDRRVQVGIAGYINRLEYEPDKQGKALIGDLTGYRSIRAVGQCYRIIYRLEESAVIVYVVTIGLRKEGGKADAYALARKLLRLHLLDPEP